ncbi:MAG: putative glycosyltransferase, exosortase G system-associated [Erysipelotrichaceae bacterium]|nr:putative glycosyltransferase, exosortase G system-associated [Erysipelotrichaceae bacterium]
MLNSILFWAAWIIIPVLMEILPSVGSIFTLHKHRVRTNKERIKNDYLPEITIIIPVYNSESTLENCIRSINDSTYPSDRIRVFLVNNGSKDNSFNVFVKCQKEFPNLMMQWLNAKQGKSKSLNLAAYSSKGKYIINIDSDGMLDYRALENMINKFESNPNVSCLTGAILTQPEKIKKYRLVFPRLLRIMEYMEYMQAFLAGRSYASENNRLYTISGAFSAFRKSAILQSRLYNTETVSEDTHLTFQMRMLRNERIEICEDALFYVDPIESFNKLYVQRQRWQRGSLEVAKMFEGENLSIKTVLTNLNVSTLLFDHTFAFPRMIWYIAILMLVTMNYSGVTLLYSFGVIFFLYIIINYFYFFSIAHFLKFDKELHSYYLKHFWAVIFLPVYNLITFFMRMAGIINSITTDSKWRTNDFTDERKAVGKILRQDLSFFDKSWAKLNKLINSTDKEEAKEENTSFFWYVGMSFIYALPLILAWAAYFVHKSFGVGIEETINTMTGPLQGTSKAMIMKNVLGIGIPSLLLILLIVCLCLIDKFFIKDKESLHKLISNFCMVPTIIFLLVLNSSFGVLDYLKVQNDKTSIFNDYYYDPLKASITAPETKKNLIYIYVESLETSYTDKNSGGFQYENYLPYLSETAKNSFSIKSEDGKLSGLNNLVGANWTSAALFASATGLPLKVTAVGENDNMSFPGIYSLGDFLKDSDYNQTFICGSDSVFGGKKTFYEEHGDFEVIDLYKAREKGYLPADYYDDWWGFEDYHLFEIAKAELEKAASQDKPFNMTMLTVDLHAPGGNMCEKCENKYDNITANVALCNDHLIEDFVKWCQKQYFYEETVIVICGDHLRMDSSLVKDIERNDRKVYLSIINSGKEVLNDKRIATQMDMYPTVLSALGFEIEGEKLGMGVNLLSLEKTIAEQRGFEWLYDEVQKNSDKYDEIIGVK